MRCCIVDYLGVGGSPRVGDGSRYPRVAVGFVGADVYVYGYCGAWWPVGTRVGKFVVECASVFPGSSDGVDDLGVVPASWFRYVGVS